jgi:hypothetical protein
MNLKRIQHLLGFEWGRLKKLVLLGWAFLFAAFLPQVASESGWGDLGLLMSVPGPIGFAVAGLALVIRLELGEGSWRELRPVRGREVALMKLIVLVGALVLPVLFWSGLHLWLHGFGLRTRLKESGYGGVGAHSTLVGCCSFCALYRKLGDVDHRGCGL